MKHLCASIYLLFVLVWLAGCKEAKQACVESEYFKMRGDSCLIIEGDTAKTTRYYTGTTYNKILKNLPCCAHQVYDLILHHTQVTENSLRKLPTFVNLRHLAFSNFTKIPEETGQLKNLESLQISLSDSHHIFIPLSILKLKKLKKLKLLVNNVPEVIFDLPHLESLEITSGKENRKFFKLLPKLKQLKKLTLGGFTTFPPEILLLKKLQYLSFDRYSEKDNKLKNTFSVPAGLDSLTQLKHLFFYGYTLDSLPASIGNLRKLQTLHLPFLKKAPKSLAKLPHLKFISLARTSGYPMKHLENLLPKLTSLQRIELFQNGNFKLPLLSQLKQLDSLVLRGNFSFLPKSFFPANLQYLYIQNYPGKHLTKFPKKIFKLKNLFHLTIEFTNISQLPAEIGQLKNLQYLHLNNQKLETIPKEIKHLKKLKHLSLKNNPMNYEAERKKIFKHLPDVKID